MHPLHEILGIHCDISTTKREESGREESGGETFGGIGGSGFFEGFEERIDITLSGEFGGIEIPVV